MILDDLRNGKGCLNGPAWTLAMDFLNSLDADATVGKIQLRGDEVYAMVSNYDSRVRNADSVAEAHRKYVDVQAILSGSELMLWHPLGALQVKTPYNSEKDCEFFVLPSADYPGAELRFLPGMFAVFFPTDIHTPCLAPDDVPGPVKKVVIKIKRELLEQ